MQIKIALSTATAMALLLSVAHAGNDNNTFIDQGGNGNQASITQSGDTNDAGADGLSIRQVRSGTNTSPGLINVLSINQSGDNNDIGLEGGGVYQEQMYNGGFNTYVGKNDLQINQTSDGNTVGSASQVTRTHEAANTLIINQGGAGSHRVGSVSQFRDQSTRNRATVDQIGEGNIVEHIGQFASIFTSTGETNAIDLDMEGNFNGTDSFTAGGAAASSGAESSKLIQGKSYALNSRGSSIRLVLSGDSNEFGVTQYGVGNSVGTLTLSGNDNELGIYQNGTSNIVNLGVVEGDDNNVGISQAGTNTATVNIYTADSDGNDVSISQQGTNTGTANITGSTNDVTLLQGYDGGLGGTNTASLNVNGDSNRLNARQLGGGAGTDVNSLTVNIWGSSNNAANTFAGVAAGAAGTLAPGDLFQTGKGNTATINVGNTTPQSDSNLFAFNQDGDGNALTGTINGSNNQVAVQQNGDSNTATITQTGNQNQVGVMQ